MTASGLFARTETWLARHGTVFSDWDPFHDVEQLRQVYPGRLIRMVATFPNPRPSASLNVVKCFIVGGHRGGASGAPRKSLELVDSLDAACVMQRLFRDNELHGTYILRAMLLTRFDEVAQDDCYVLLIGDQVVPADEFARIQRWARGQRPTTTGRRRQTAQAGVPTASLHADQS